jgi:hypothetical protein
MTLCSRAPPPATPARIPTIGSIGRINASGRWYHKMLIGPRLRARGFAAQQTEAAIGVAVLNWMLVAGRPDSVRCRPVIGSRTGIWGHLALRSASAPMPRPRSRRKPDTEVAWRALPRIGLRLIPVCWSAQPHRPMRHMSAAHGALTCHQPFRANIVG